MTAFLFVLGIAVLATYVANALLEDYEALIGQAQKSAASHVARSLEDSVKLRQNALVSLAERVKNMPDYLNLPLFDVPLSRSTMRPSIAVPQSSVLQTS